MYSRFYLPFILAIMAYLVLGCSNSGGSDPVLCPTPDEFTSHHAESSNGNCRALWGLYRISIDKKTLTVDIVPLRSAEFNANVTMFMQPPLSPTNRIAIYIDLTDSDIPNGIFAVDVTLMHPFPSLSIYSGFDVRGIFMSDGSVPSQHYSGLGYAGDDESRLLNADGWTRWWNPSEFTTYNTILGYTEGSFSSPGFMASATLNPYKYFADGIECEDELEIDPATRGFFSTVPGTNQRRYMIRFAMDAGSPVIEFNYAVDAGWYEPSGDGPTYTQDDYPLSANCQEAYMLKVEPDPESTAWWVSDTENGGDLIFDITVYDWQSVANPDGVPGEVAAIWVESAELLGGPVDVYPTATPLPDGPTSSVFHVEIADVSPSGLTGQTLFIGVESSDPADYAPQIEGITGFDYPEEPLAAFIFWDAPILDEEPVTIPIPLGFDNCAAAGVVKLFWDEVTWPALAGYNLYKKLSTEPSFDFGSPLNTVIITGTEYVDDAVLMDETTYDYVVTAVDLDTTESVPSVVTTATPVYVAPTGFTDLDDPDKHIGSTNSADFTNAYISADGTVYMVYGSPPIFVRADISDPSDFEEVYLEPYADGRWADVVADSEGNAHVVWASASTTPKTYYYAMVTPENSVQHFTTVHSFIGGTSWPGESSIAVTPDDEVHIAMSSYDGDHNLAYVHGEPGNFSSVEVLTDQVYEGLYNMCPDMTADRFGNLHVAWTGTSGVINYMKRDSNGVWGSVEPVSSGVYGHDEFASVTVDYLGAVHVAWHISSGLGYWPGYANNRSGPWLGFEISGCQSVGCIGIACDPDGNAYVDCYHSNRVYVSIIDRDNNVIETSPVNDNTPYAGGWCSFAGQTDPCYDSPMLATWRDYSSPPAPWYGRIQAE